MAYVPTRSDATAVATDTIARLNTPGSPNAGAVLKDALVAVQDSMLCSVGFQAQNIVVNGSDDIRVTTFSNFFSSWSFTAPIAKTYLLHIDMYVSSANLNAGIATGLFQLLVNGSVVAIQGGAARIDMLSTTPYYPVSWRVPVSLSAGSNTIQLQAKVAVATQSVSSIGGGASRAFTITG